MKVAKKAAKKMRLRNEACMFRPSRRRSGVMQKVWDARPTCDKHVEGKGQVKKNRTQCRE